MKNNIFFFSLTLLLILSFFLFCSINNNQYVKISGNLKKWETTIFDITGPSFSETDNNPNPFLDYRLNVNLLSPTNKMIIVPGFFAGDGKGGGNGNIWRIRFTPDEEGKWQYRILFRTEKNIAISLNAEEGFSAGYGDGISGEFIIEPANPQAGKFSRWGLLEYNNNFYLKFREGPYWIRGGTDSPENFLAYAGFDNTPTSHFYSDHLEDWHTGDPDWGNGKGKAIIGAINYLSSKQVNSIYMLTMNVGGDGHDVWPWIGTPAPIDPNLKRDGFTPYQDNNNDNLHFDISKLFQWEIVFDYAQKKGIFLHFVLNEAEEANKKELDLGELGVERKLYYRELIARFAHHLALEWNLSEEYNLNFDFGYDRIKAFAQYIYDLDPYHHPITVHPCFDPLDALKFTFGDSLFSLTSIQLGQRRIDTLTEEFRQATQNAGRPLPISMDEFTVALNQNEEWHPRNNSELLRKEKLWPVYLSGGMIEFILEDLLKTDSFKSPELEKLWDYTWFARKFMEENLPFWEMSPADHLVTGESTITVDQGKNRKSFQLGAQVFAKINSIYAIYYPSALKTGKVDLKSSGVEYTKSWYNPRNGKFEGEQTSISVKGVFDLGPPPHSLQEDWVVLIKRKISDF